MHGDQPAQWLDHRDTRDAELVERAKTANAYAVEGEQVTCGAEEHHPALALDLWLDGPHREPANEAAVLGPQEERAAALAPRDQRAGAGELQRNLAGGNDEFPPPVGRKEETRLPALGEVESKRVPAQSDGTDVARPRPRIGVMRSPEAFHATTDEEVAADEAVPGQVHPVDPRNRRDRAPPPAGVDDAPVGLEAKAAAVGCHDHRRRQAGLPLRKRLRATRASALSRGGGHNGHRQRRSDRNRAPHALFYGASAARGPSS